MAYYIDTFSPHSYAAFSNSAMDISGVREARARAAERLRPGDKLICYLTKLSRWVGVLRFEGPVYRDSTPRFVESNDPFVIRFKVNPLVWLPLEKTIPIREKVIWDSLSFTRNMPAEGSGWTGLFRASLNQLPDEDGEYLEHLLMQQEKSGIVYAVDQEDFQKLIHPKIRSGSKEISVSVPQDGEEERAETRDDAPTRQSIKIQALVARIGEQMGFKIWLPRNDRSRVMKEWRPEKEVLLDELPVNFDPTTVRTIEQIGVLWIKRRSIIRAFEIEHTTSIYSGILRMADLLALQPNIDIKLHLVATAERRGKVFDEIQRPVFSLLEQGPLSERCTFISYDSLLDLANQKFLSAMSDRVIEEYEEAVE